MMTEDEPMHGQFKVRAVGRVIRTGLNSRGRAWHEMFTFVNEDIPHGTALYVLDEDQSKAIGPMCEIPEKGVSYWRHTPTGGWRYTWTGSREDFAYLNNGLAYATREGVSAASRRGR